MKARRFASDKSSLALTMKTRFARDESSLALTMKAFINFIILSTLSPQAFIASASEFFIAAGLYRERQRVFIAAGLYRERSEQLLYPYYPIFYGELHHFQRAVDAEFAEDIGFVPIDCSE